MKQQTPAQPPLTPAERAAIEAARTGEEQIAYIARARGLTEAEAEAFLRRVFGGGE